MMDEKHTENRISLPIPKQELSYLRDLLSMTGDEAYQKYGTKRNETVSYTVRFSDALEADIYVVPGEGEDRAYAEAVLFDHGQEIFCADPEDSIEGEWELLDDDGNSYIVEVTEARTEERDDQDPEEERE